ncbi:MAG: OmpA family protein [Burkholderia sp.]|jgi:outer membrane protein OmpA-like peptidoglycan-associated protein|uniref:OmpA family protein n=1 Tax=Burkholderia sp. TaxID=36773 RepID=UPI00282F9EA1|nr:OmpA family protein [Burkholderia sp.]MDR0243390.1 OmpA family protein [Burkholderia sp.]
MTRAIKAALAVAVSLATASGVLAQEPAYHRDIRDLKPTILDLKGLSSDANSASLDLNAQVAGLAAQHSGLSVRQDKTAVRVSMLGDVLFDFDKASIQPSAEPTLQDILRLITAIPAGTVVIEGHTDSKGSAAYNRDLSVRRAHAVADWLTAHGAKKSRLSVKGFGGTRPVASNTLKDGADNPDGRKLNRRVEFVLPNAAGVK